MSFRLLTGERGSITIAITVAVIATISGLTMSSLAFRDNNTMLSQGDSLQEFHLVRSEIGRGEEAVGNLEAYQSNNQLPYRKIQVSHGYSLRSYITKTKVEKQTVATETNVASRNVIKTRIRAFAKKASFVTYNNTASKCVVEKYAEKIIQKETFAGFMYLTNTDESVNGDQVYFYGYDEIWGRVHSNTDIWIKNVGGWPTFHGLVTTAGHIEPYGGTPPYEEVFLGGYEEEYGQIEFNPSAELIRANGRQFWQEGDPAVDIADIKLTGVSSFSSYIGDIRILPSTEMVLYNSYPPFGPIGDSIGVYNIAFKDTLWTPGVSDGLNNQSAMIWSELWMKGESGNAQTWGCASNIYLIGDITYHGTVVGEPPDGVIDPEQGLQYPLNHTDYLGIVSEKSIYIQYGLFDPADSVRKHVNCGSNNTVDNDGIGIYIYGALCALADNEDTHLDGVFTFNYQHPHRSTPNQNYQSEYFNYVDLHLGKFPPNDPAQHWPWPAANAGGFYYPAAYNGWPDYPWYNPIWPELNPFMERGNIYLFGAVSQVRRGFVHRSPFDSYDQGVWDLTTQWMYGQSCAGLGVNSPEATGSGVGYNKAYHYDTRFMDNPPPDFPEVHVKGGETPFKGVAIRFMRPTSQF
jgi:hypothetical protein